ncbi:MAG: LptF/LptG family permease, partial [Terriglobales bacterium]
AFACLALALPGLALGLRGGRGGKAGGLVLTLLLVVAYYLVFILGLGLARQGRLPPLLGAWTANLLFFAWGTWALLRLDRIPRNPITGADPVAWFRAALSRRRPALPWTPSTSSRLRRFRRWSPSLIEAYLMREFLSYTALLLAAFLLLVLVFTTFELISSILHNHIGLGMVAEYLLYFSPQTLYMTIPVAILMGVLITFGLMSKANEVTAVKASGVSVFRLLFPVLMVAALLAAAQFALDASWMPAWNQKQDALHAAIKGQAPQTYSNPEHKWVFGRNNDVYYFSFYDASSETFADVSVFQLDPADFLLRRRIFARQARWDRDIGAWVFTDGWERNFAPAPAADFQRFQVASFAGLAETPAYFRTDSRPGMQMSYSELHRYIQTLRRSGYDVGRLSVTLAQKITYPLASIIMVLLAFPFALSVGRRGTVAGISIGIGVAIAYWSSSSLLQALGNLNQMPAPLAAWAPDLLFLGAGVYLLMRVPT